MEFKNLIRDQEAVSPVIGVILMVAITVILAAVIGTFVLGLGDQVSDTAPQASFTFDLDKNGGDSDVLTVTHDGGDKISASNLNASVNGADTDFGSGDVRFTGEGFGTSGDISAGDTYDLDNSQMSNYNTTNIASPPTVLTSVGGNDDDDRDLDLSGATVRITWQSSNGGDTATLGKWTGPDA